MIQKVWHSHSQIPSTIDKNIQHSQQNKYRTVTSMLEQSAREYQNNDALLLLAELNFVSANCMIYGLIILIQY